MDRTPLMPKATAVWLVDNTSLTFEQIAEFCGLHVLEVKGIADGDVAHGIKGMDPISSGQLSRDEIAKAEEDTSYRLEARRAQGRGARGEDQARAPLHAGVAPPGPPQRHPLAAAQPSRAQGLADHAAGRHDQADHHRHSRPHPLELAEPCRPGSGDARSLQPDRSRRRGQEGRGEAGARAARRTAPSRPRWHSDPGGRNHRGGRSPPSSAKRRW